MKTRKIILMLVLGMFSIRLFAQQKISGQQNPDKVFKVICERYSGICNTLNSEPIENLPKDENAVRLVSISNSIIRLVWTESSWTIEFTEGNGNGTKIVRKKTLDVSEEAVKELLALLEEKDFYNQPSSLNVSVRDGTEWFVEANIDGKYKALVRPCPERTFLNDIGEKLFKMAGEWPSDEELEALHKEFEEYQNSRKLLKKKR